MDFFAPYMDRISALCKEHNVRSLHAFGSAVKGTMGPESDVDLVVDLQLEDPLQWARNFWELEEQFADLFTRPVDLSGRSINNKYLRAARDKEKVKLYEA